MKSLFALLHATQVLELWSIFLHSGIFCVLHHYHISTTACPRHPLTPTQQPRNHGYNWPCCQKMKTLRPILHIDETKTSWSTCAALIHLSRAICPGAKLVAICCGLISMLWCKFMCKGHLLWPETLFNSGTTCFPSELAQCLKALEAHGVRWFWNINWKIERYSRITDVCNMCGTRALGVFFHWNTSCRKD